MHLHDNASGAFFNTTSLPYPYDPKATCPLWIKTLGEIFENDIERGKLLQEWFGLCLTNLTLFQKIMLLEGPTRAGKSTVLKVLANVVGTDNVVSLPLTTLGSRFGLWPLIGRNVAICPDAHVGSNPALITEKLKEAGIVSKFVGGLRVTSKEAMKIIDTVLMEDTVPDIFVPERAAAVFNNNDLVEKFLDVRQRFDQDFALLNSFFHF